jgi:hypothetical protein
MDNWPVSLPRPQVEGCAYTPQDNQIRTEMRAGVPKARRATTARPVNVTFQLVLTQAQVQTLDDFVAITLSDVLPFQWMDFRKPDGEENVAVYRFIRRPHYTPRRSGMRWNATVELELLTTMQGAFLLDIEGLGT